MVQGPNGFSEVWKGTYNGKLVALKTDDMKVYDVRVDTLEFE